MQDRSATLDLAEIGGRVRESRDWAEQTPVVWGVNLLEVPRFCRNPYYRVDPSAPLREALQSWPGGGNRVSTQHYEQLWRAYLGTKDEWQPRAFLERVAKVLGDLSSEPEALATAATRLAAAMTRHARDSHDAFRPAQVGAAVAVALHPYIGQRSVAEIAELLVSNAVKETINALEGFLSDQRSDRFALLRSSGGGFADLYYLPLRVARVLAWAAGAWLISSPSGDCARAKSAIAQTSEVLEEQYGDCIVALSDVQAPLYFVVLCALKDLGLTEQAERTCGRLFHSLVRAGGKIAREDLAPERALNYLLARWSNSLGEVPELLEQPMEMLTVLLLFAEQLGLSRDWDPSLWRLDGVPFGAFLPESYEGFSAAVIEAGRNDMWTVGFDVFKVEDFISTWRTPQAPSNRLEANLSILSALLFPDRVPWFLLPKFGSDTGAC